MTIFFIQKKPFFQIQDEMFFFAMSERGPHKSVNEKPFHRMKNGP
jgi:hypothetical protein